MTQVEAGLLFAFGGLLAMLLYREWTRKDLQADVSEASLNGLEARKQLKKADEARLAQAAELHAANVQIALLRGFEEALHDCLHEATDALARKEEEFSSVKKTAEAASADYLKDLKRVAELHEANRKTLESRLAVTRVSLDAARGDKMVSDDAYGKEITRLRNELTLANKSLADKAGVIAKLHAEAADREYRMAEVVGGSRQLNEQRETVADFLSQIVDLLGDAGAIVGMPQGGFYMVKKAEDLEDNDGEDA